MFRQVLDFRVRPFFCQCHEEAVLPVGHTRHLESGKIRADIDAFVGKSGNNFSRRSRSLQQEFTKERLIEFQSDARNLRQQFSGIAGFLVTQSRHLIQATRTDGGKKDGRAECEQSLVRTDVAGGFVAADMLFAGLKIQGKAILALTISRLADQATGHFANIFIAAGEDTQQWTAILQRRTEGLSFGDGDVNTVVCWFLQHAGTDRIE